ncbi:MAG: sigma-70 family RNA polymerase sigma factor [Planctomycetota bacterium]|nr:MAG: sigma-70 family RNA polymerase sigma factor [Planctomycetota bacterium]
MLQSSQGDRDAFASLVCRYQERLFAFFFRLGVEKDVAEELVQETFLKLHCCQKDYRKKGKFSTFLYTIARNLWIDWLRKQKRIASMSLEVVEDAPFYLTYQSDRNLDVEKALQQLSEKLRIVLVMSIFENFTHREIADILDIPLGTVKSRIHLALERLKEYLAIYHKF